MQDQLGEKRRVADCSSEQQQRVHMDERRLPSFCANGWWPQSAADSKQVQQGQAYAEAVFDALPDPVAVMDLDGRIRHANRRFLHAVGQTQEQVFERTPSDLGLLSSEQFNGEVVPRLIREGSIVSIRTTVQRPDGCSFPALLSFGLLRNATGGPEAIVGTSRDISPLEQAYRARADGAKTLQALVHAIPESLLLLNSQGRVLACNETAARRTGRSVQELVGSALVNCPPGIVSPDLCEQRMAEISEVLHSGEPIHFTEERDGLVFEHVLCSILDDGGQVAGNVLIFSRDVTRQIRAEKESRDYCEQLRRTEQLALLGTLSATLIHELTQPLSVIQLANQTALAELKKLRCRDVIKQDLEASLAACATIAVTMDRFRNYARQSVRMPAAEVHISNVAAWTIRLLEHSAQQAKVTLRTENLEALPAIRMPENEIKQLFFVLTQNAVQAANGDRNRYVLITGVRRSDMIELVFEDDCGGIEPACLPRLFEPFFTTKPLGKGMGLGLCVVRRIVRQRGGQISVQNQYGKGVRFVVSLPAP
ncbi:MAG: PAS domain-containing protein [Sedimentisphaerales bacterium]|nr:PAS domain-containing protein [Sedimentisphaerales bacterium]